MPDFNKYSNYSEQTSFSAIVSGANAPVLEVELNELQQIQDTRFGRLSSIIGNCVHPMSNGNVSYNASNKVLTITNCVVIAGSFTAFIKSASVTLSATNKVAYVKLEEKIVDGSAVLKEFGNTAGANIPNPIIDSRVGTETSRRRLIAVTLTAGASVPADNASVKYAPVGTLEGAEFIPEYVVGSLIDLGFSVNNDGELCVTFEE